VTVVEAYHSGRVPRVFGDGELHVYQFRRGVFGLAEFVTEAVRGEVYEQRPEFRGRGFREVDFARSRRAVEEEGAGVFFGGGGDFAFDGGGAQGGDGVLDYLGSEFGEGCVPGLIVVVRLLLVPASFDEYK